MANQAFLTKQTVVTGIQETLYNDATVPVAGDAILVDDVEVSIDGEVLERAYMSDQLGAYRHQIGRIVATMSGSVELKGAGVAYEDEAPGPAVLPEADAILRCCGIARAVNEGVGVETVTYTPASDSLTSSAFDIFMDGKRIRLRGCMGTGRFIMPAGERARFEFNIQGLFNDDVDAAIPAVGAAYSTVVPPIVQNASATLGGTSLLVASVELDLANEIAERPSINAARGLFGVTVVSRKPAGSIDPEFEPDATTLTDVAAGTHTLPGIFFDDPTQEFALTVTIGTGQYNRFIVTVPRAVMAGVEFGDRDGVRAFTFPFMAAADFGTADTDWQVQFT